MQQLFPRHPKVEKCGGVDGVDSVDGREVEKWRSGEV
jgi:hypothetical protein